MIKFTRLCDDNSVIKNENGDITSLKVQTYGVIDTSNIELVKQDMLNGLKCEPYYLVSMQGTKTQVLPFEIVNLNNKEQQDLYKGIVKELEYNSKGKALTYKGLPCKVVFENNSFYAQINIDLAIYNI